MDSSMDDSAFEAQSDGSDFGPPAPKTKAKSASKTGAKTAAPKPGPKKAAAANPGPKKTAQSAPKAKPAASKKRPKPDSEDEDDDLPSRASAHDDSLLSNTPPSAKKPKKAPGPKKMGAKPLREIENEAINEAIDASMHLDGNDEAKPKKGSTESYQKLTQLEHILKRPDTYIGSVEMQEKAMWVYNSETESMEMRQVNFVPGLYKIFDEILVNAADNKQRDKNMDSVKVTIDRESGQISVFNNGRGIPIEIHEKEKIYIPEMIFGHLLTSSNYDDDEQKVTGGRNGYGAKLCNVYSTQFTLETVDSKSKKKYKQTWTENMSKMGKASITDNKSSDDFTKITFTPDYAKFKMQGVDDDFEALVKRRVYDLAGTSKGVKVWLNGERLKINSFKRYMEMYTKAIKKERGEEAAHDKSDIITDNPNERWEVGFAVSDGSFQQVSFVNSIATTSGGTHVNYIADQVCNKLLDIVKKKKSNKAASLKTNQIKNHIFLFVNCLIVNPAFTSQTKEQMTTKHTQFGSKCNVSDEFLKKIAKTEVVENILHFAEQKADQILKKSDGSRRSRMDNPKLTDANKAGTRDGWKCTLVLTEGDSAKGLALAGRSVVSPDLFGVYPLRGKMLNVRDASIDQISKNAEIQNIKNFLGLKHKTTYEDCKSLRYGHLMIMTDQDHDGSHIKGLLINFLQVQYPSLLKIPGFLLEFITPIVKVWKGPIKNPSKSMSFFTMPEWEAFKEAHQDERGWEHKYYKGLGTSSAVEAQAYFRDLDKHLKEFHTMQENEVQMVELAFSKKMADERKEWLRQFVPGTYMDHSERVVSYTDFINKELILYSMADNIRSIPSVVDGLKPGQRKVLFTCFKRNVRKDMKVVELAGAVSGFTAYQHGENNLQMTIVNMAQNFVGSNNVNYLEPSGNFGSRLQGGQDAASARYIYTRLSPFARKVFHTADEPLLNYNVDDDKKIEPQVYVPVVPLVLINGSDGIGTGWSSNIPNYHPEDVVENLKLLMEKEPMKPMRPWFRNFKGAVAQIAPDRYKFSGIIRQTGDTELEITELPVRVWTQDYKEKIVEIIKAEKIPSFIKDYDDYNTFDDVHFVIRMEEKYMKSALEEGLEEKFKLSKTIATSNLVAFDEQGRITKYATVEDIMKEFFGIRYKFYQKRKANQIQEMSRDLEKWSNQKRFIQMIIDGSLVVAKKKKIILVQELRDKKFTPFPKNHGLKEKNLDPMADEEGPEEAEDANIGAADYDYLLGMPIWSLTRERIDKLNSQIDDRTLEIETLTKMTIEEIWKIDLDDFISEWRAQLDEEAKRHKRSAREGRRESKKLHIGAAGGRKRKGGGSEDSDFEAAPSKAKKGAPKAEKAVGGILNYLHEADKPKKQAKPKAPSASQKTAQSLLTSGFFETSKQAKKEDKASDDPWLDVARLDGAEPAASKPSKQASGSQPSKKAAASGSDDLHDSNVEEVVEPAATGRRPRAAAAKPVKYNALTDSDSDGDGMLFDVGKMVKGIDTGAAATDTSRPLFSASMSRPGSSAGLPRKSTSARDMMDIDAADDTDYTKLAPPTTSKGSSIVARKTTLSDDEADDSLDEAITAAASPPRKASKAARPPKNGVSTTTSSKLAPKPKAAPVAKKPTSAPLAAPTVATLSPAAKAYAAKKAKAAKDSSSAAAAVTTAAAKKNAREEEDDEVDKMADELMDDDDDDEDDDEEDEEPVVAKKPPRRAAAAAAAVSKKKKWVGSDEDDEEEEELSEEEDDFDEDDGDDESF